VMAVNLKGVFLLMGARWPACFIWFTS
jgi:hypothetical protein